MSEYLKNQANARHDLHADHDSSRPLSDDYELVGIAGEFALQQFTGMSMDLERRPRGDGGIDGFMYVRYSVDVKAARKPGHLIHEVGKKFADILILAEYSDDTQTAELLGWEWGQALSRAPTKDFGYGIVNHYIPRDELRDLDELRFRLLKFV